MWIYLLIIRFFESADTTLSLVYFYSLVSNNLHVNQPTCNLAAVNRATDATTGAQQQSTQHGSAASHTQANKMPDFASKQHNHQPGRQNNTSSGSRNVASGAPQ